MHNYQTTHCPQQLHNPKILFMMSIKNQPIQEIHLNPCITVISRQQPENGLHNVQPTHVEKLKDMHCHEAGGAAGKKNKE